MKRPILLTKKELIIPLSHALSRLNNIREYKLNIEKDIVFEGFFVLAVASFENAILDSLKRFLSYIPHKLDIKSESFTKEEILSEHCLERAIENKVITLSYRKMTEIIEYFIKTLSLSCEINSPEMEQFQEIKARRNLLIHNDLFVNKMYEDTAGPLQIKNERQLSISRIYLNQSIQNLESILLQIQSSIETKYQHYTRISALKNLWRYTFDTPVMKFENEWLVNEESDFIYGRNSEMSRKGSLSSSEGMFYNVWQSHICGTNFNFEKHNYFNLSEGSRRKFEYLLSVVDLFKS